MSVLEAQRVVKVYGGNQKNETHAIRGIDLQVDEGEFVSVMGPSGSGKTTLLNILSGIDQPTSGVVKINDQSLTTMKKNELALFRRRTIGFIFQDFNLLDSLSLKENVMLPMILDKKDPDYMEKKVNQVMQFLGIWDVKDKYPYNVSGGQQQKTSACRALINDPAIIFADEPTGNLDSKSSHTLMNSFEALNQQNSTILMVTHDPVAASFSKRIVFIKDGQIHMEINRKDEGLETRKEFFERILDCLAILGGEAN